mmetsp:Transcript_5778/g.14430  ORF Transcript_5778/g.14430 Transcript_5778/m.14430 type:complete len:133 (-) Transcript_5778:180-578(-)|eukprot:CAMPEP_0197175936 /NCGR_PEP_ID=MMETSP1423-20130617/2017_1 /TAXON_ID=476441 /ORGANISM="Pseudo-nitzschia heimii, Strain UNC1101" /LENGTH=132 /DNA_ID=CAMNT_0042625205 /DNA_START=91 /DNA_END=489 /DNA_ORIENTATION=-
MNYLPLINLLLSSVSVLSFGGSSLRYRADVAISSTLGKDVMSDIDLMCLENVADVCSFNEECDLEEREALLSRFAEETFIMAERMATMNALVKHLKTGDHQHLGEEEVSIFQEKILNLIDREVSEKVLFPLK